MSDEAKRHPPSEPKLARLRAAGALPASPALVGVAVLLGAWLMAVAGGEAGVAWAQAWLREALQAAGDPENAAPLMRGITLRAGLLIGGTGAVLLTCALVAQIIQAGPRSDAALPAGGSPSAGRASPEAWRGARVLLLSALAGVAVAAAVRGALLSAEGLMGEAPLEAVRALARSLGWPLLAMLVAVAALEAFVDRAAWVRGAWMTRRELEEELRDTEGPPLTRERRSATLRRRSNA